MKVDSPDLSRKSEVGGVRLNIANAAAVRNAYHDIIDTVGRNVPDARINGVPSNPSWPGPMVGNLRWGCCGTGFSGPSSPWEWGGRNVKFSATRPSPSPP